MTDHSLPYLVNCSILLTDIPLLDRPRARLEMPASTRSSSGGRSRLRRHRTPTWPRFRPRHRGRRGAADRSQLRRRRHAGGHRGILSDPAQQAFRDNVDIAVGIAETLGTLGLQRAVRQPHRGFHPRGPGSLGAETLAYAAVAADQDRRDRTPRAGQRRAPLSTQDGGLTRSTGSSGPGGRSRQHNLRFLADLYHLDVNGDDTSAVIRDHGDRIGHVQIADAPGAVNRAPVSWHWAANSRNSPRPATPATSVWSTRRPLGHLRPSPRLPGGPADRALRQQQETRIS